MYDTLDTYWPEWNKYSWSHVARHARAEVDDGHAHRAAQLLHVTHQVQLQWVKMSEIIIVKNIIYVKDCEAGQDPGSGQHLFYTIILYYNITFNHIYIS